MFHSVQVKSIIDISYFPVGHDHFELRNPFSAGTQDTFKLSMASKLYGNEQTSVIHFLLNYRIVNLLRLRSDNLGGYVCKKPMQALLGYLNTRGEIKVKNSALDFTVPTGGADLRFSALQPGSAMGGGDQPSGAFAQGGK